VQAPDEHTSPAVQAFESVHGVESATAVCTQPDAGSQDSVVQAFPSSLQDTGLPATQVPDEQASPLVQALSSLHGVESATATERHPEAGSHDSAVQAFPSSAHETAAPGVHEPATQRSLVVQALESEHGVESGTATERQPIAGSHDSAVQAFPSSPQSTAVPATQLPVEHASPEVQAFSSLQLVPSARTGCVHSPLAGRHVPTPWQSSIAAQETGLEPTQLPAWHASVLVQRSSSSHALPSGFAGFEHSPVDGLHSPAKWHRSLAAQVTGLEPTHVPL
jgi:hypothetical protein